MRELLKSKLVWFAALGYFVDLFDLVLYGVVRVESLESLGFSNSEIFSAGATLLNFQMAGMLIGGFFWGILGDRRGRREALFGSIFIYSVATFLNAYVHSFEAYAALRFLAGVGLAGELGAAITIVSEALPQKSRGLGSAFIASIGFLGAAVSSYVAQTMSWQNAYRLGGALGFALLIARVNLHESLIYTSTKREHATSQTWGSIRHLFFSKTRLKYFVLALLAGVPIWYVAGILSFFAPEFGRELEIQGTITAGTTIMMGYMGSILGDIICGFLSQILKSRKKAVFLFMALGGMIAVFHPYFIGRATPEVFYWTRFAIGLGNGFFAILIAWIAELYGTNLRATATTSLANLIRASVIPLTLAFRALSPSIGLMDASIRIGAFCFGIGLLSVLMLPETFHRDLKFFEK